MLISCPLPSEKFSDSNYVVGVDNSSNVIVWREIVNESSYKLEEVTKIVTNLSLVEKVAVSPQYILLYGDGDL